MNFHMDRAEESSLEAIGRFVLANENIRIEAQHHQQFYDWVEYVLVGQQYAQKGNAARALPWCGAASRR
jgi:hypothetical protein